MWLTTWSCHSNPNHSSKNRKIKNKNKTEKENKKKLSLPLSALTYYKSWDKYTINIDLNIILTASSFKV